jgi:hypothetical protein
MGSFSSLTSAKKHNAASALSAKVELRRNILDAIGAERAHVFDAYSGPGAMHAAVWSKAATYVGCDEEWFRDERRVFVADNQLVLRTLDLKAFNVFDLDAYGSPWEVATIVAARRGLTPGEQVGIALTDGTDLRLKMSGVPHAFARLVGMPARSTKLVNRSHELMASKALGEMARRMGGRIVRRWVASSTIKAGMQYHAMIVEGCPDTQAISGS